MNPKLNRKRCYVSILGVNTNICKYIYIDIWISIVDVDHPPGPTGIEGNVTLWMTLWWSPPPHTRCVGDAKLFLRWCWSAMKLPLKTSGKSVYTSNVWKYSISPPSWSNKVCIGWVCSVKWAKVQILQIIKIVTINTTTPIYHLSMSRAWLPTILSTWHCHTISVTNYGSINLSVVFYCVKGLLCFYLSL